MEVLEGIPGGGHPNPSPGEHCRTKIIGGKIQAYRNGGLGYSNLARLRVISAGLTEDHITPARKPSVR